jgi:hypothetical protein
VTVIASTRAPQQYSIEHAVMDGIRYHEACSVIRGLREATETMKEIRHPGPETMKQVFNRLNEVNQARDAYLTGKSPTNTPDPATITSSAADPAAQLLAVSTTLRARITALSTKQSGIEQLAKTDEKAKEPAAKLKTLLDQANERLQALTTSCAISASRISGELVTAEMQLRLAGADVTKQTTARAQALEAQAKAQREVMVTLLSEATLIREALDGGGNESLDRMADAWLQPKSFEASEANALQSKLAQNATNRSQRLEGDPLSCPK